MARAERDRIPHFHIKPRNLIFAAFAVGGLASGTVFLQESEILASKQGSKDDGGNRIVAPLPTLEPTQTATIVPTEVPTPTPEPTFTPTSVPIPPSPTRAPVFPTAVPPTARPRPTEAPFAGYSDTQRRDALISMINSARQSANLPQFKRNALLDQAAESYAKLLAFTPGYETKSGEPLHIGPDGSTMESRIKAAGYLANTWGEIIVYSTASSSSQFLTAEQMFNWWLNSPPHRTWIYFPEKRDFGGACYAGKPYADKNLYVIYCVVNFALDRPLSQAFGDNHSGPNINLAAVFPTVNNSKTRRARIYGRI